MAILNLTGQATVRTQFNTRWTTVQATLLQRKPIWDKLSTAQKKAWLDGGKDPLLTLMWQVFLWLLDNFFSDYQGLRNG